MLININNFILMIFTDKKYKIRYVGILFLTLYIFSYYVFLIQPNVLSSYHTVDLHRTENTDNLEVQHDNIVISLGQKLSNWYCKARRHELWFWNPFEFWNSLELNMCHRSRAEILATYLFYLTIIYQDELNSNKRC